MSDPRAKGAILDRDGTLIDVVRDEETGTVGVAFHPKQVRLLGGVADGLRMLRDAGWRFAIATNQPAPAKGQFSAGAVAKTNAALVDLLRREGVEVATVEVCMHHPVGGSGGDASLVGPCDCRKPESAMLVRAAAAMGLPVDQCWMIGDSASDIGAARAAGARAALVFDTKRCELCPLREGSSAAGAADVVGANMIDVARALLAWPKEEGPR